MFKFNTILITTVTLLLASNVSAANLADDVYELQVKTKRLVTAVKANRNAILTNTNSISDNSTSINNNSAAILINTTNITSNTADIKNLSDKVASVSAAAIYDYKDYASNVASKTFSLRGSFGDCDTETRTYTRIINGDITNLTYNRLRSGSMGNCNSQTFDYELTNDAKKLVSKTNNDYAGNVYSTDTLAAPLAVATSSMVEGKSFGGASGVRNQPLGGAPVLVDAFVNTVTVEGVQDVTVPAGTFIGCLKIHTVRTSNTFGYFNRYSWHCPGIGEVKRIQNDPSALYPRFWDLVSYNQ